MLKEWEALDKSLLFQYLRALEPEMTNKLVYIAKDTGDNATGDILRGGIKTVHEILNIKNAIIQREADIIRVQQYRENISKGMQ